MLTFSISYNFETSSKTPFYVTAAHQKKYKMDSDSDEDFSSSDEDEGRKKKTTVAKEAKAKKYVEVFVYLQ